jgi:Tol biopolymer transport system component
MPTPRAHRLAVRLAVLALALAALGCDGAESPLAPDGAEPLPAETASPAPDFLTAGTGPRILFASARTGGTDIYRMDPSGNNLVRVTSFAGSEDMPAWSWDNKHIAIVRDRLDGSNVLHKDIFLMNADGTGKHWARTQPSTFAITNPSWSHDGTRLVVSVWVGGVYSVPYLAQMNVATGEMNFIGQFGAIQGLYASFDPTGKKLVYVGANGLSIETINLDGTGHQGILASPTGTVSGPVFSPDGKRIAYGRNYSGNYDVYVTTLLDGTVKRLTTNIAYDFAPTWSADGTRIAFVSFRSGKSQIWTMTSSGGSQTRITHTTVAESSPAWSH